MASQLVASPAAGGAIPLLESCSPRELFVRIRPVAASGRADTEGHPLHLRYRITRGEDQRELRPRTVAGPNTSDGVLELRLGGNQRHVLRHYGTLDLVGGVGNWTVEMWEGRSDLAPHWHRMPALLSGATPYVLPFYERIGTAETALLVTDTAGVVVTLGREPVAIATTTLLGPALGSHWIWTEWWG